MLKFPLTHVREKAAAITPSMRWDGKKDFSAWQNEARVKLDELVGLPYVKCDDNFQIEYQISHETFYETRFIFQSEDGFYVPCHFWAPKNASGTVPLVICLQGHNTGMHISMARPKYPQDEEKIKTGDRDFAVRALKEGYCALIMEQRCFGELGGTEKGTDCVNASMASLLIGRTMTGNRVWDLQRTLDVMEKYFKEFDRTKIICMGHSGGGTTTVFAACLEPRIKYAMPSCFFCSFDDAYFCEIHQCVCNFVPGIRLYFDIGDLAGLIAPRPMVVVSGLMDPYFPQKGVHRAFREAERLYAGAGAADKVKLIIGDGGHQFYADQAWETMNRFL